MKLSQSKKFDPNILSEGVLEHFQEFIHEFNYVYDSLNREPPASCKEQVERTRWISLDKRKIFLGRFSHRNLQKQYIDLCSQTQRDTMSFEDMVKTFTDKFRLSANMTLANFKFRGLTQNENENFDLF